MTVPPRFEEIVRSYRWKSAVAKRQCRLRQLVETLAETLEAHREADAFLRCLEDDEGRGLAGAHLADQLVVHDHLGDATIGQAAHEAGAADIGIVDLEAEPGRQQHPERRDDAHQAAFLIAGLEHDHRQPDIGAVLGGYALHQRALLALRTRRGVAADLPVAMDRTDRALCRGLPAQYRDGEQDGAGSKRRGHWPPPPGIGYRHDGFPLTSCSRCPGRPRAPMRRRRITRPPLLA